MAENFKVGEIVSIHFIFFSSTGRGKDRYYRARNRWHSQMFAKVWMGCGGHEGGGRKLLPLLGPQSPGWVVSRL